MVASRTILEVREPGHYKHSGVLSNAFPARFDDVVVDHVGNGNRLLANSVVERKNLEARQIELIAFREAGPLAEYQPGLVPILFGRFEPLEEALHEASRT